jgi:hypothetical protein
MFDLGEICGTGCSTAPPWRPRSASIKRSPGARLALGAAAGGYEAGRALAKSIQGEGLRHVFVLSDGLRVNGSDLVKGLADVLSDGVTITGASRETRPVRGNTRLLRRSPSGGTLAVLGFYGDA